MGCFSSNAGSYISVCHENYVLVQTLFCTVLKSTHLVCLKTVVLFSLTVTVIFFILNLYTYWSVHSTFELIDMHFTICITLLMAGSGIAVDPFEERMTKMEGKIIAFTSSMEVAMMRMREELETIKTQITIKTEDERLLAVEDEIELVGREIATLEEKRSCS